MDYSQILAKEFNIKEQYATNIISLLDEGNTIYSCAASVLLCAMIKVG